MTTTQKDQLSQKNLTGEGRQGKVKTIPAQYLPQATLQYRTFLKRSMVEAFQNAFKLYKDPTLEKARIGIDYQTSRINFPNIVVKYNERSLKNMGVAHTEWANTSTLTELEAPATLDKTTGIATLQTTGDLIPSETIVKGQGILSGTFVREIIDGQHILLSQHPTKDGETTLFFKPVESDRYIPFHHYIYNGDISLEVYGLSSADRDRVSDSIVEIVGMGTVSAEGSTFQERLYETVGAAQFPYSGYHFIAVNTDILNSSPETEELAPWMPEDVWVYKTAYSFGIMGEFYSIVPELPTDTLGLVQEVDVHPSHQTYIGEENPDIIPVGGKTGEVPDTDVYTLLPREDYPEGEVPAEDYIPITKRTFSPYPALRKYQGLTSDLSFKVSFIPRFEKGANTGLVPKAGLTPKKGLVPKG